MAALYLQTGSLLLPVLLHAVIVAGVGEIALTANEYKTAGRLRADYWLYAVFNCTGSPQLHAIQDPARLGWTPVVQVEHYHISRARFWPPRFRGTAPEKGPGSSWSLRSRSTQEPRRLDFDDRADDQESD